jgi:hypothetical protein
VDRDAALEELRPQAEREPRRLDGGVQAIERTAEEERRCAAAAHALGVERNDLLRLTELRGRAHRVLPRAELRLGRRHAQHRRGSVPGVDAVRVAPGADAPNRVLGRAADRQCCCVPGALPERGRIAPQRLAESSVPPAGAVPAHRGLEQEDIELRLELEQVPGGPEPEVAAAHDDDVC